MCLTSTNEEDTDWHLSLWFRKCPPLKSSCAASCKARSHAKTAKQIEMCWWDSAVTVGTSNCPSVWWAHWSSFAPWEKCLCCTVHNALQYLHFCNCGSFFYLSGLGCNGLWHFLMWFEACRLPASSVNDWQFVQGLPPPPTVQVRGCMDIFVESVQLTELTCEHKLNF